MLVRPSRARRFVPLSFVNHAANQGRWSPPSPQAILGCLRGWTVGEGTLPTRPAAAGGRDRAGRHPRRHPPPHRQEPRPGALSRPQHRRRRRAFHRQGLVTRRQGSGTWVRAAAENAGVPPPGARLPDAAPAVCRPACFDDRGGADRLLAATPTGAPAPANSRRRWCWRSTGSLTTSRAPALGYTLRRELAHVDSSRGLEPPKAEILVDGHAAGHRLDVTAFVRPGELVLLEDPRIRARSAPTSDGSTSLQHSSPRMKCRAQRADRRPARLRRRKAHLRDSELPGNPTGVAMPRNERSCLARLAAEHGIAARRGPVRAGAVRTAPLRRHRSPSTSALADGAQVVTIGSLSESSPGGLRVGWIGLPSHCSLSSGGSRRSSATSEARC